MDQHQEPPRKLTKAECGRIGGNATKQRHGREHYVRAGKLGFAAGARAHAAGHARTNVLWLQGAGKLPAPRPATTEDLFRLRDQLTRPEDTDHDQR